MEKTKPEVVFLPKAENSIFHIYLYIAKQGNPENAEKFYHKLYDFGRALKNLPDKYPICKQPQFAKRNMHCAVFHKDYVFVYKFVKTQVIIYTIIHCNTNSVFHSV